MFVMEVSAPARDGGAFIFPQRATKYTNVCVTPSSSVINSIF